jgi:hypothetical protein
MPIPGVLIRRSVAASLLRLWVRIPPGEWISVVSVVCCIGSLCDEVITRPEESYRMWCVVVWSRNLYNEEAWPLGAVVPKKTRNILYGKYWPKCGFDVTTALDSETAEWVRLYVQNSTRWSPQVWLKILSRFLTQFNLKNITFLWYFLKPDQRKGPVFTLCFCVAVFTLLVTCSKHLYKDWLPVFAFGFQTFTFLIYITNFTYTKMYTHQILIIYMFRHIISAHRQGVLSVAKATPSKMVSCQVSV